VSSCPSQPATLHATRHSVPCWSLHRRHDGQYCLRRCHCETGEIPLSWRSATCWRCHCRPLWSCTTCHPSNCHTHTNVVREHLAVGWFGCIWWIHALRCPEDSPSCQTSRERFDPERRSQREHFARIGFSKHLYQNGADSGNATKEEVDYGAKLAKKNAFKREVDRY
jgi:hypothetical protein